MVYAIAWFSQDWAIRPEFWVPQRLLVTDSALNHSWTFVNDQRLTRGYPLAWFGMCHRDLLWFEDFLYRFDT